MKNNQNKSTDRVDPLINQTKANKDKERHFNLVVDGVPYRVEFDPFFYNDQVRYHVCINGGPTDDFVWDDSVELFRATDDNASVLPAALEKAISTKLQNQDLD